MLQTKRDDFEVWQENWEAVTLFLRLQTQWVISGMGGPVGMNYQSVEFLFKLYRVKDKIRMLEDIQEIELGALDAFNRQAEKRKSDNGS